MTTETNQKQKQPITICGIELPEEFPRGFRLAEQKLYEAAAAEHKLDELREDYQLQETRGELERKDSTLEVIQKAVTALEKRLTDLYDADELNIDAITQTEELLAKKTAEQNEKTLTAAAEHLAAVRAHEERAENLLRTVDLVNLQTAHALLEHHGVSVPAWADFLDAATEDDYEQAGRVVEAGGRGGSPLARYISRASRAGSKKRSDLN